MSWSLSFTSRENLENNTPEHGEVPAEDSPVRDQYDAAKRAAFALIDTGCVGTSKEFGIYLSGHANPQHEPTPGWANDCVAVNVSQKSPVAAPAV